MPRDIGDLVAELTSLVPGVAVDGDPQDDVAGVLPRACVHPTTVDDLAQVVGWASCCGLAMAARGGGTKSGLGNPPSRLDLVLDMSWLDSVTEYDPEDLVLTAQAGISIARVREMVREDSLVLPLDPQGAHRATIGGVVACADHGPRRRQYGGLRDLVLGLKVILPDGSPAAFGGRTLKNVAGYDVGKLFIGSLGTIGVITEVTVRLLPRPACEELLLITLPGLETAHRLVAGILASPLLPSTLELVSPACAERLGLAPQALSSGGKYLMLVALEGHPADVKRQVSDISAFCEELGLGTAVDCRRASEVGSTPGQLWDAFSGLREKALGGGSVAGFRCRAPLASVWDLAAILESQADASEVAASYTMSCGTGCLEAYAAGASAPLRAFVREVRAHAEKSGGALSVLDGWSTLGREFDAWGGGGSDRRLMHAVKQKFDSGGVMNPGRFVGGL